MVDAITAATASGTRSTSESRTALADNFDMFLVLLTEQLKNQDPLSPLDSEKFVGQLVQFSSVEQQIQQTEHLETLIGLQNASETSTAVSFLGQRVIFDGADGWNGGDGVEWEYTLSDSTNATSIAVLDASNRVVAEASGATAAGTHSFRWNGLDNAGNALPVGQYRLSLSGLDPEGDPVATTIRSRGEVAAVDLSGAEASIQVGGLTIPLADIRRVLATPASPPLN